MRALVALLLASLLACSGGQPQPTPSPTSTPTPAPTPTPSPTEPPAVCIQPTEDNTWEPVAVEDVKMHQTIRDAQEEMGSPCGEPPEATLFSLASRLTVAGYCAGRMSDEVWIERKDGIFEAFHPVAYADGCFTSAKFMGTWRRLYL